MSRPRKRLASAGANARYREAVARQAPFLELVVLRRDFERLYLEELEADVQLALEKRHLRLPA